MNDFSDGLHAVGTVDFLVRFRPASEMPTGLPIHAGALTCPVTASALASLPRDFSPTTIAFESLQLGEHPIIAMKLSLGEREIIWLVDAQDPDVWMAIDLWKQMKVVPIVLGIEQGTERAYRFYLPQTPDIAMKGSDFLDEKDVWRETDLWSRIVEHAKSHPVAYPLMSARVPPLPRPADFLGVRFVRSPAGF